MSSPTALLPADVVAVLARLNPLEDIPLLLISTPLRQRHHFLSISPGDSDPAAYLAWPSTSAQETENLNTLLAALPSANDADSLSCFTTVYTHDGETTLAHVHIPVHDFASTANVNSGLRLVFRWEGSSGDEETSEEHHAEEYHPWKYHDARLMPFPSGASTSPMPNSSSASLIAPVSSASFSTHSTLPSHQESSATEYITLVGTGVSVSDVVGDSEALSEDDSYWNSYGRDSDDEGDRRSTVNVEMDDEKAEDAYWARYNAVQGTADSTIPSPVPAKQKLLEPSYSYLTEIDDAHSVASHGFDASPEYAERAEYLARLFLAQRQSGTAGPYDLSPQALELRLHSISPRQPPPSSSEMNSHVSTPAPDARTGVFDDDGGTVEGLSSPDEVASFGSDESLTLSPPSTDSQRRQRANIDSSEPAIHSPRLQRSHDRVMGSDPENTSSLGLHLNVNEHRDEVLGSRYAVGAVGKAHTDSSDIAVRDALKGVYRLWTATRSQSETETFQKERFVGIVRGVLEEL